MKSSPVLIVGDGSGIGTALRSSSFSHWPLGMPFFLSSPPTSFLGTVPVLRPFLLPAPLRFMMVLSSAPLTASTLVGVTVLTLAFLQANPFHLQALLMVLTAVPILPPAMTSAMDASIPVDGFLAILTAIFLSTPKSMSTISLTTSFIRSRMSIQMI